MDKRNYRSGEGSITMIASNTEQNRSNSMRTIPKNVPSKNKKKPKVIYPENASAYSRQVRSIGDRINDVGVGRSRGGGSYTAYSQSYWKGDGVIDMDFDKFEENIVIELLAKQIAKGIDVNNIIDDVQAEAKKVVLYYRGFLKFEEQKNALETLSADLVHRAHRPTKYGDLFPCPFGDGFVGANENLTVKHLEQKHQPELTALLFNAYYKSLDDVQLTTKEGKISLSDILNESRVIDGENNVMYKCQYGDNKVFTRGRFFNHLLKEHPEVFNLDSDETINRGGLDKDDKSGDAKTDK